MLRHYSRWALSSCSKTCGRGIRIRYRTCIKKDDLHFYFCNGPNEERKHIPWYLEDCKGTLGQWTNWSTCSTTCGEGTQQHKRRCNGPGDCNGLGRLEEERDCPDLPLCKGTLGQWSQWSECSTTCGEGTQQRQKRCIGPGDCNGLGNLEEERVCLDLPNCIGIFVCYPHVTKLDFKSKTFSFGFRWLSILLLLYQL